MTGTDRIAGVDLTSGYGDRAIDYKACKAVYLRFAIRTQDYEALSILWVYLQFKGKQDIGCNLQEVADWTGAWNRKRFERMLIRLIEHQCVEKIPFNGGYRWLITRKGLFVLKYWDEQRGVIIADIQRRAVIARDKAEAIKLRRQATARDNKGRFKLQ